MATRLLLAVSVLLALGPVTRVSAQTLGGNVSLTTAAPGTLVCDQTGTATVTLQIPTAPFELMLVIDESGSIASTDFVRLKNFMIDIVRSFRFGPEQSRVGVVMFSSTARLITGLNANQQAVMNVITGIQQRGGATCIGCGIALADQQLQAGARPGVPRFMIVLTDGRNNAETETFASVVATAKASGTTLLAVGVAEAILAELQQIASAIPGIQTTFFTSSFSGLGGLLESLTSLLPTSVARSARLQLTVAPEFTPTGVLTSQSDSVATITGNTIEWTIDLPTSPTQLSIDIRRASTTTAAAEVFTSFSYQDMEGRQADFQNATVALSGCDTDDMEGEIEDLQAQIVSLSEHVAGLQDQVAALSAERSALIAQIDDLQTENAQLREQLEHPEVPTGTGAASGIGQIVAGPTRHLFAMSVHKAIDGNLKAALELTVCQQVDGQADDDLRCLQKVNRLTPTLFTAVQFSDDPSFGGSGSSAQIGVDTVVITGAGIWNGVSGYRFSVTATDRGDGAAPNDDTFHIVITAADGTVVASATGSLAEGAIEISES